MFSSTNCSIIAEMPFKFSSEEFERLLESLYHIISELKINWMERIKIWNFALSMKNEKLITKLVTNFIKRISSLIFQLNNHFL